MKRRIITSIVIALFVGIAITVLSMLWGGLQRGLPFPFAFAFQPDAWTSDDPPPTRWYFKGFKPLVANVVIWTMLVFAFLRLVKGTSSALVGVGVVQLIMGYFIWREYHEYLTCIGYFSVFNGVIFFILAILARRIKKAAAVTGCGLYIATFSVQTWLNIDAIIGGLMFEIPNIVLIIAAIWFAHGNRKGQQSLAKTEA